MLELVDAEAVLITSRLVLEPIQYHHACDLYLILQDERIYRYIPTGPPVSQQALAQRYQLLERRSSPSGDEVWLNWAVRLNEPPNYIGVVQATVQSTQAAYLAYEFAPESWGRGYATEACRMVLDLLFRDYTIAEVLAEVDTRNMQSLKLLERLGFERRSFRAAADYFKGSSSDEYMYRLATRQDHINARG
ncbi:MAG: GNAT family N-acetyltransferase [Herpetosiphonaceae bacterium]|nr:GNAT family N-acetyltransferase [Herpetosiphonaceae bacterium]